MKQAYSLFLLLLLLQLPAFRSYGQQPAEQLVSGDFVRVPFEEFVRQLEAQTSYRFYFDPQSVDSLRITLRVQNQPLPTVLYQALLNTN